MGRVRAANGWDVIDYYGDRQICDRCGVTVSTYGDVCAAALDNRCEGFETYDGMLLVVGAHLQKTPPKGETA